MRGNFLGEASLAWEDLEAGRHLDLTLGQRRRSHGTSVQGKIQLLVEAPVKKVCGGFCHTEVGVVIATNYRSGMRYFQLCCSNFLQPRSKPQPAGLLLPYPMYDEDPCRRMLSQQAAVGDGAVTEAAGGTSSAQIAPAAGQETSVITTEPEPIGTFAHIPSVIHTAR